MWRLEMSLLGKTRSPLAAEGPLGFLTHHFHRFDLVGHIQLGKVRHALI